MRALWQRLRAGWKQNPWIWLACIGLMLAALSWSYTSLTDGSGAWEKAANVGQIAGIPLTALSIVATLLIAARASSAGTPQQSARVRLARQVHTQESAVRTALLGGIVPADVTFARTGAPRLTRRPATGAPDRDAPGNDESGETAAAERLNPARRIQWAAARLVSWRETSTMPAFSEAAGSDTTVTAEVAKAAMSGNVGAKAKGNLSDIINYFIALPYRRLVIVGEKGSGKTVLAIELVIGMAQAVINDPSGTGPVAVRFSAATWARDQPFPLWLAEQLTLNHLIPPTEAKQLIDDHLVLPVLDGLDEMDLDLEDTANRTTVPGDTTMAGVPARAIALISELNRYTAGTAFAPVVLTTRTHRHAQLRARGLLLDHGHTITIQPLTAQHISDYLADRYHDHPLQLSAWEPVLDRLNNPGQEGVLAFLSTPWQLMLATTAISATPAHAAQLSARHDSTLPESAHQTGSRPRCGVKGNERRLPC
ncbi:NACHT domain-containing protein [Streptosporangium sp. NPDC023615]|uniref:NACHT domain-containing protein n=1 Tax=Streptosporangium sp. NPDC023615 TaxID=3154794 RepID=UPI003436E579